MLLELHKRNCPGNCKGTGLIRVSDARQYLPCTERNRIVRISMDYWIRLGRPKTVEEYQNVLKSLKTGMFQKVLAMIGGRNEL